MPAVLYACAVLCCASCRQHLRDLLEAADDDDDFETVELSMTDEDDAMLMENVAAQLSDDDLQDFCDTQEIPEIALLCVRMPTLQTLVIQEHSGCDGLLGVAA